MTRATNRVAVVAGGHASEHAISRLTGEALIAGARGAGFAVIPVLISESGEWLAYPVVSERAEAEPGSSQPFLFAGQDQATFSGPAHRCVQWLMDESVDCVVLGLHGSRGEDGSIQGFFETVGLPFTGSGTQASAFAIDKIAFKHLVRGAGLPTPKSLDFSNTDQLSAEQRNQSLDQWWRHAPDGAVIKAKGLGSSVGVELALGLDEARSLVSRLSQEFGELLVEERIVGRELTVPVISDASNAKAYVALPVIEIIPQHASWFDYSSKYASGGAEEIVPADISKELASKVQQLAIEVHRLIGARGVTRTDFMVDSESNPWIIETNTLPGLTAASLVPKAAAAVGWSMSDLVLRLVEDARSALDVQHQQARLESKPGSERASRSDQGSAGDAGRAARESTEGT